MQLPRLVVACYSPVRMTYLKLWLFVPMALSSIVRLLVISLLTSMNNLPHTGLPSFKQFNQHLIAKQAWVGRMTFSKEGILSCSTIEKNSVCCSCCKCWSLFFWVMLRGQLEKKPNNNFYSPDLPSISLPSSNEISLILALYLYFKLYFNFFNL